MSSHVLVSGPTTGVDRLIDQIRSHSLRWAEQLAEAGARGDLEGAISRLFNDVRFFKELIAQANQHVPGTPLDFAKEIHQFMLTNLHRGPTLKTLAKFLGYSEKYCSELFQVIWGNRSLSILSISVLMKRGAYWEPVTSLWQTLHSG